MPRQQKLGCCEYTNRKGETAHILGCCCDCDVLDAACDRCLRCQTQNPDTAVQVSNVIADRLRIPWLGGAGAIQINLDSVSPILIIPTLLVISITHYYVAWAVSAITPLCLIAYYRCWRRNPNRTRTKFFFSWGLVSVCTMGYVFITATFYREIYLAEGMIVLGLFLLMLYSLYLTKQDPGSIRQDRAHDSFMRTVTVPKGKLSQKTTISSMTPNNSSGNLSRLINERLDHFQVRKPISASNHQASTHSPEAGDAPIPCDKTKSPHTNNIPPNGIQKTILQKPAVLESTFSQATGCEKCYVKLPPRASHCNVCQQCFAVRDHHCIWLDQCIGLRNHRAFIMTVVLFLMVSTYGVHLTLTTVCTPIMVLDFFLIPADCRFVYADLLGAIAYVSCCYTVVSIILVLFLFIQQVVLISQNITLLEFNRSIQRRGAAGERVSWWRSLYISDNPYCISLRSNWLTFIRRTRHEPITPNTDEEEIV